MSEYTFGELLKQFRARSRLTQKELAARIGYSRNSISNWERFKNEKPPSRDIVLRIADSLELNGADTNGLLVSAEYTPNSLIVNSGKGTQQNQETLEEPAGHHGLHIAPSYHHEDGLGASFYVRITNHGQRPVTITNVSLRLKSGASVSYNELSARYIQLPLCLPAKLDETDFLDFLFPLYHMQELTGIEVGDHTDVLSVEVVDSLGQQYDHLV